MYYIQGQGHKVHMFKALYTQSIFLYNSTKNGQKVRAHNFHSKQQIKIKHYLS